MCPSKLAHASNESQSEPTSTKATTFQQSPCSSICDSVEVQQMHGEAMLYKSDSGELWCSVASDSSSLPEQEAATEAGSDTDESDSSRSSGLEVSDVLLKHETEGVRTPAPPPLANFNALRCTYLSVILVIYLADGLQGTHLYKLYDGYGFSVASLYCLGFFTGGVLSPITGPWVDKMGRRRAAILYCVLEIFINTIEQYPYLICMIASRMIGGLTTNLLQCVFETWLDSEFRHQKDAQLKRRSFQSEEAREAFVKSQQLSYELLMRDAVIVSNAAAIGSGYLSHILSEWSGPVGPFRGAVVCTVAALAVVSCLWTENYGGNRSNKSTEVEGGETETKSIMEFLEQATDAFMSDMRMLRVGIVQGLSVGSLQIFVYLWSPILMDLAKNVPAEAVATTWGLDRHGEPAFGLIFMVFMCACVLGGMIAPFLRQAATALLSPIVKHRSGCSKVPLEVSQGTVRPMAVEFLAAFCYLLASAMLLVPCIVTSFSQSLMAFCFYEVLVGIVSPCEGVIRSIYFPAHARASVWTLPSLLINAAVSLAVFGTQFVSLYTMCFIVVVLMVVASCIQISLVTRTEWSTLGEKLRNSPSFVKRLSSRVMKEASNSKRRILNRFSSFATASTTAPTCDDASTMLQTLDACDSMALSAAIVQQMEEKNKLE